ncbi:hypothetical protein [Sphingobium phenoxybenzoativorans]|uniref:hypothetical protein n=1 Tax=Sphingobium phenoxybenzoativorans TaxID=1592790 RepID=UPI0008728B78|nr:hypothetical protein [Sphingobium phenoxybenzoativorans]
MIFSEEHKALIEDLTRMRGWISNSYAQIEYLLGDLILRCRAFPEYTAHTETFTHSAAKRIKKVRAILGAEGPMKQFAEGLLPIIDQFEKTEETRNLLAHGFCQFHYTPSGDAGLYFQKFHRQPDRDDARLVKTFTPRALQEERDRIVPLAHSMLMLVVDIHNHFGWLQRDLSDLGQSPSQAE